VTALPALAAPTGQSEVGPHAPRQASAYLTPRRAQLAYPAGVAAGYPMGSGLAESACKRLGTARMKGAGRRWTISGAQAVATLRRLVLSDRWHEGSTLAARPHTLAHDARSHPSGSRR
jgi:hypothetical protein